MNVVAHQIVQAQLDQERLGHLFPEQRKFYVLPRHGWLTRLRLRLTLPAELYERIEWSEQGAVFLARKSHELA